MKKETLEEVAKTTQQIIDEDFAGGLTMGQIIPKEEPKTFKELFANTGIEPTTDESGNIHYKFKATLKEVPKQETLIDAAERLCPNSVFISGFIKGAKWQEQQTIEEVFEWLTTNNYLTDLKETLINNFKNR